MAEGSYEYECMRAELLGIEVPDRDTFEKNQREQLKNDNLATEEEKIVADDEQINDTTGKIDELNSILSLTQQKLNKFKRTCGSLTSLLKFRQTPTSSNVGSTENLSDPNSTSGNTLNSALDTLDAMTEANVKQETNVQMVIKSKNDLTQKVNSQIGKLDSMLRKTENASLAMQSQNKQMRRMVD